MAQLAATSALILAVFGYVAACAVWPFANCRKCDGNGKFRSPTGRAWRKCKRCKGSGTRIRGGRRAWNRMRDTW